MASKEPGFGEFVQWSGMALEVIGVGSDVAGGLDGSKYSKSGKLLGVSGSIYSHSRDDGVLTVEETVATGVGVAGGAASGYVAGAVAVALMGSGPPGWVVGLGVSIAAFVVGSGFDDVTAPRRHLCAKVGL